MTIAEHIQGTFGPPGFVVQRYLEDLTDAELLARPAPNANHIAWQLGHLLSTQRDLIEMVCPGAMSPLPPGFAERHNKQAASLDDPQAFLSKAEYLRLIEEQRTGMLAALAKLSDDELSQPSPEKIRRFAPSIGAIFSFQIMHWMMHAGQWVIVRRKLGREPLF